MLEEDRIISAIILMNVQRGKINEVARGLSRIDEVVEVHSVAGIYDLVLEIKVKEYGRLSDVITEKIQSIEGIEKTMTMPCFKTFKV